MFDRTWVAMWVERWLFDSKCLGQANYKLTNYLQGNHSTVEAINRTSPQLKLNDAWEVKAKKR